MKYQAEEFYPTPTALLETMTENIQWRKVETVLEPSAGKGDIAEYCRDCYKKATYSSDLDMDCIEKDRELQSVLKGKHLRVVHDDFLTFHTHKHYDLIIMNPPFSCGAKHLCHALSIAGDGTGIICVLNAETIRNPYTNERKALVQHLEDLGADIQYYSNQFAGSERPTNVEVAVIKVFLPEKEQKSHIFESLKKKVYQEKPVREINAPALPDFVDAAVQAYNLEVEAGLQLIREYKGMVPHILSQVKKTNYSNPILTLEVKGDGLSENRYVREVRRKYWEAFFNNPKITGNMTSNLRSEYSSRVSELTDYDFSFYNIKTLQEEMSRELVRGIEDCIVEIFDKLSYQYSYSDELSKNIHYYNGWKTNKAWIINKKVILPFMNAFSSYTGSFNPSWKRGELADIEKALNYLDGGLTDGRSLSHALDDAERIGQTRKIESKYFFMTFYKKGTCHIEFKDMELLKKLNIFGSQQKGWLPPSYGKAAYKDMSHEEQAVVEGFEGKDSYARTMANADYFIYDPKKSVLGIEACA